MVIPVSPSMALKSSFNVIFLLKLFLLTNYLSFFKLQLQNSQFLPDFVLNILPFLSGHKPFYTFITSVFTLPTSVFIHTCYIYVHTSYMCSHFLYLCSHITAHHFQPPSFWYSVYVLWRKNNLFNWCFENEWKPKGESKRKKDVNLTSCPKY